MIKLGKRVNWISLEQFQQKLCRDSEVRQQVHCSHRQRIWFDLRLFEKSFFPIIDFGSVKFCICKNNFRKLISLLIFLLILWTRVIGAAAKCATFKFEFKSHMIFIDSKAFSSRIPKAIFLKIIIMTFSKSNHDILKIHP